MKYNVHEGAEVKATGNIMPGGWDPEGHYVVDGVDLDYGDWADAADQLYRKSPLYAAEEMSLHSLDPRVVVVSGDLAILHS